MSETFRQEELAPVSAPLRWVEREAWQRAALPLPVDEVPIDDHAITRWSRGPKERAGFKPPALDEAHRAILERLALGEISREEALKLVEELNAQENVG